MMNNKREILEGLDPAQKEAVECVDGPVLIVAGAGSGKTRVLTSRIAYIIAGGSSPERILALTFTKKAAGEMKERIGEMVGQRNARRITMGTFHSVFVRFLREYADRIGFPSSFTIYDRNDSESAIKRIVKDMKLDEKVYKPKDVLNRISKAKDSLVLPQAYKNNATAVENDRRVKKPEICNIYAAYFQTCKDAGVMDFDDILLYMNLLMKSNPAAAKEIASRFDYILVDEYQDTNFSQYLILRALASENRNLCVVGDDSQSIYGFRGADIGNILNFRKQFPECKIFRLEQNYRSTKNIVEAANSVIAKNTDRIPKKCYSKGEDGQKIHIIKAYSEDDEGGMVASRILSIMQDENADYQDFAILYRTNSQSRALEEALRKRNIPYVIYSGRSFFDRAEIKDMMSYFKLSVNPNDDESFLRIVNTPARGIGDTTLQSLRTAAGAEPKCSMMEAIESKDLTQYGLRPASIERLKAFASMMGKVTSAITDMDAYEAATKLADFSGLYAMYKTDGSVEAMAKAGNIEELMSDVQRYIDERRSDYSEDLLAEGKINDQSALQDADFPVFTLADYLEDNSLLSAVDMEGDEQTKNKVTMMTVHSAKGLEFPYVFITGLEDGLFPSGGMFASPSDIEEERRLFYVALTRAKKRVALSYATSRMRAGKTQTNPPSRFLKEIDSKFLDNPIPEEAFYELPYSSGFTFGSGGAASSYGKNSYRPRSDSYGQDGGSYRPRSDSYGQGLPRRPGSFTGAKAQSSPSVIHVSGSDKIDKSKLFGPKPALIDPDFVPVSASELKEGQRVEHNRFGLGTIISIYGGNLDRKAKIQFDSYGEKILLLKYAKLRFPK